MIVSVECREGETSLKLKQPGKAGCGAAGLNFLKTPQTLWPGEGEARGPRGRDHVTGSEGAGGRRLEAAAENFKAQPCPFYPHRGKPREGLFSSQRVSPTVGSTYYSWAPFLDPAVTELGES